MEQTHPKMSNLQQRVMAGIIGGAIFIGAIWFSQYTFFALFLALTVLGLLEFYNLVATKGYEPNRNLGVLLGAGLFVLVFLIEKEYISTRYLFALPAILALVFVAELYRKKTTPFVNIAFTLLAVGYVATPFAMLHLLGFYGGDYRWELILGIMFLIWTADSGAYFAGKTFGRTKLLERISPGKTWEGWLGGTFMAIGVGVLLFYLMGQLELWQWIGLAVIVSVFGVLGDLAESMLKRSLGVKDSGTLIPGHGGILDRFDSLLLVVPFAVAFLKLF